MFIHHSRAELPSSTPIKPALFPLREMSAKYNGLNNLVHDMFDVVYLPCIKRKNRFLFSAPAGTFSGLLQATPDDEYSALRKRLENIRRRDVDLRYQCPVMYHVEDRPLTEVFFRIELIATLAKLHPDLEMLNCFYDFMRAVEEHPPFYFKHLAPVVPTFKPFDQRPTTGRGHPTRGLDFTPYEITILCSHIFFGRDPTTNKHTKMTPEKWAYLLDIKLQGQRTRKSVLARVALYNRQLKERLMVDGYLDEEGVRRYKLQKLGERAGVPIHRPRLDGTYYPGKKTKAPKSTLATFASPDVRRKEKSDPADEEAPPLPKRPRGRPRKDRGAAPSVATDAPDIPST